MTEIENDCDYYYAMRDYLMQNNKERAKLENSIMRYEINTGHNIFGFTDDILDKKLKELGY